MKTSFVVFLLVSVLHTSLSDLPVCVHEPDSLCFDPTCATPLFDAHAGQACGCNDDNIGVKFLPCDTTTNTMEMIYFWRPPATCIGGSLPLPVSGIPCNISCPAGAKLNLTTLECDSCGVGTISTGGGHTWSSWFEWPAQYSTHCAIGGNGACSSWRLLGDHVDSGNNFNGNYLESVLNLDIYLAEPGTVTFQYTVSAEEGYDGLFFLVDDVTYFFKSNMPLTLYSQAIPAGYHSIQWQYYKDFSVTSGQDRAVVYGITVTGIVPAQVTCDECPLGSYQNLTGQSNCTLCPPDTFNGDTVGATTCKPCPEFTYSLAGATSCIPKRNCNTSADLTWYYTPCIGGSRTKVYTLVNPPACDIETFVLPANVSESCTVTACLPGQYLDTTSGNCFYCFHGTSGDGSTCTDCDAGHSGSLRVRYFMDWSSFPLDTGAAYTGCDGNCFTGGWRLGQYFIDSGLGHGSSSLSWFEIDVELWRGSSISFTYAVPASYQNQLIFSVNGFNFAYFRGDNCTYSWNTWQRRIFWSNNWDPTVPRTYNFRWTYVKNDGTVTSDCDRAIITSINITGIAEGAAGSASCPACASGSFAGYSGQETCDQCQPGTSSLQGSTYCFPCTNDTITDLPGTPYCIPCGANTVANDNATACEYNCSLVQFPVNSGLTEPTTYDMAQLPDIWSIEYGDGIIYGSLCGHNPMCNDETFVCFVGNDTFTGFTMLDMGRIASITELAGNSGVQYKFLLGDTFGFGFRQNQTTCTTTLNIRCDPAVQTGTPVVYDDTNFDTQCNMVLAWNSIYGCPFCTVDDYSFTDGDCTDGKKMRHYYWTSSLCVGGSALPADGPVACTRQVSFNQSSVVIGVVVAVVVAALVAGAIGFLYYRNKKLGVAYNTLKSHTLSSEPEQQ